MQWQEVLSGLSVSAKKKKLLSKQVKFKSKLHRYELVPLFVK